MQLIYILWVWLPVVAFLLGVLDGFLDSLD